MDPVFSHAGGGGLIDERPEASVDATGLESRRQTSAHHVRRVGYKRFARYRRPKLTIVGHGGSHLIAGAVVSDGPSRDSPQFPEAVTQAARRLPIDRLLGDAAFDGEHNHVLARERLGIRSTVIKLNPRRTGRRWPRTRYRRQMRRRFHKRKYRQRSQVESIISRHKRRLGSAPRARSDASRERECLLRVLTHDLMILGAYP